MPATIAANFIQAPRGPQIDPARRQNAMAASNEQADFEATLATVRGQSRQREDASRQANEANNANAPAESRTQAERKTKAEARSKPEPRTKPRARAEAAGSERRIARKNQSAREARNDETPVESAVEIDAAEVVAVDVAVPTAVVTESVSDDLLGADLPADQQETAEGQADDEIEMAIDPAMQTIMASVPAEMDQIGEAEQAPEEAETSSPQPTLAQHVRNLSRLQPVDESAEADDIDAAEADEAAAELADAAEASLAGFEIDAGDEESTVEVPDELMTEAEAQAKALAQQAAQKPTQGRAERPTGTSGLDSAADGEPLLDQAPELTQDQADGQQQPQDDAEQPAQMTLQTGRSAAASADGATSDATFDETLQRVEGTEQAPATAANKQVHETTAADKPARPVPSERAFAAQNHDRIVTGVRTQLLPNGGSMQIRLNPENLGAMNITVSVVDGVVSAAFQTTSDEATKLLSHTLGQLKTALEGQGVSVDKIQVQQAPREVQTSRNDDGQQPRDNSEFRQQQQETLRQQQERRHLLNRMWEHLANGGDPLDLVA